MGGCAGTANVILLVFLGASVAPVVLRLTGLLPACKTSTQQQPEWVGQQPNSNTSAVVPTPDSKKPTADPVVSSADSNQPTRDSSVLPNAEVQSGASADNTGQTDCFANAVSPSCGEICNLSMNAGYNKKFPLTIPVLRKQVNCPAMLQLLVESGKYPLSCTRQLPFTRGQIPPNLWSQYTNNGSYAIKKLFLRQNWIAGDTAPTEWPKEMVEDFVEAVRNGSMPPNPYSPNSAIAINEALKSLGSLAGKRGLIVGSRTPWVEAILLHNGIQDIVTLEYGKIITSHPQLTTMLPEEFLDMYNRNHQELMFDIVVSFSSLEHAGLTRYGDPPRPYGDLEGMAQVWCVTRTGGWLVLGVPGSNSHGRARAHHITQLFWNAHRAYGTDRLALLAANWEHKPPWTNVDSHLLFKLKRLA